MEDTIAAIATPIGRSGIGVVRLSGAGSLEVIRGLVNESAFSPSPRKACLKIIISPQTKEEIDEALITYFKAPNSFTGEDIAEISCHGSPVLLREIIEICLGLGARIAGAGEFTLRALANGRLNLAQAEAIRDLIDAQSSAAARQSIRQLRGEFSNQLQPLRDELLNVIVVLESALEFVEDDLPGFQQENIKSRLKAISGQLRSLAQTYKAGRLLREGLRVAFVGKPNVGKSSVFNAMLGHERAIVTNIAGTTRDALHEKLIIKNIPISLIDTAGLRETTDAVETIGVERTKQALADADLIVAVFDGAGGIEDDDKKVLAEIEGLPHIIAINKIDLGKPQPEIALLENPLMISAKNGIGIAELEEAIIAPFLSKEEDSQGFLVSDARHYDLLNRAAEGIDSSLIWMDEKMSEEIILIGLHNAIRYLGEITGETTTEDMLTRIFSTFCIGK